MSGTLHLWFKANQRIFINGAVLQFDRKVRVDLLNEAVFLLESHVLQPDELTTPLRQLYFVAQTMLMDPGCAANAAPLFEENLEKVKTMYTNTVIASALSEIMDQFHAGRLVIALKLMRALFMLEAEILGLRTARPAPLESDAAMVAVVA